MFAMAYPPYLKEKARTLRRERNMTIDDLAERLALSRSTIYYWVRDLPIPPATANRSAAQRRGTLAMQRRYTERREEAYREGVAEFGELAGDPEFRDFVCLYIAEGFKRDRNKVSLGNSDPAVIKVADRWVRRFTQRAVGYSVQYHADQDVRDLQAYWGELLAVEPSSIGLQRKSNSSQLAYRTWRCRYGVLTVRTCDTLFRARLQAWMDLLRASWT